MDKLTSLISQCKFGFYLSVNPHRDYSTSVVDYYNAMNFMDKEDIDGDVFEKIIETDTIIKIQFYPNSPIGCYIIHHYDLDAAIDVAISCIKNG